MDEKEKNEDDEQYGEIEQHQDVIERDAMALEAFIDNIYSKKVRRPEQEKTSFWNIVGIETTLYTVSALGAAILSSIRTGSLFYILEQVLLAEYNLGGVITDGLSFGALITSLLAFEGFLLAVGFSNGRQKKKASASGWGILVAFIVVMGAGIFSGLGIVNMSEQTVGFTNVILALITGVGASIITFFGGENIGFAFQLYGKKKKEIVHDNQAEYNAWRDSAQGAYTSSRYYIHGKKYKTMMNELAEQRVDNMPVEELVPVKDVIEHSETDEVTNYHYVKDVKNGMTQEQKIRLYEDGHAGLRNTFPGIAVAQVQRWSKNLERDLTKAGVIDSEDDSKQGYYEENDSWDNVSN